MIHFLLYWHGVIKQVTEFDIFLLVRLFCFLPVHADGGEGSSLLEFNRASLNWSTVNFLTRSNLIFEHLLLVVGRAPPNYALKHFEFEAHNSLTKGKKLYVSSSARQSDASKKTGCIVVDDHNYPQKVSVINSAHDNNQSHHVSCSCVLSTPPYTNRPFIANTTKYIPIYKMKWCRCCQQNRSSATVPLAPLPSLAFAIFFLQHKSSNSHDIHREFW